MLSFSSNCLYTTRYIYVKLLLVRVRNRTNDCAGDVFKKKELLVVVSFSFSFSWQRWDGTAWLEKERRKDGKGRMAAKNRGPVAISQTYEAALYPVYIFARCFHIYSDANEGVESRGSTRSL